MRQARVKCGPSARRGVHRVVPLADLAGAWREGLRFLVQANTDDEQRAIDRLRHAGLDDVDWVSSEELQAGDIVSLDPTRQRATVLVREEDVHQSLFLTNRCNSYCLMCSQPPTSHDDSWLAKEALSAIGHMLKSPTVLGLTGGEPLLLRSSLRLIIDEIATRHPATHVELLTNGRLLSDHGLAAQLLNPAIKHVTWLVPLYGHADFLHDFVVQAPGAFEETLTGLFTLQKHEQPVQLRVVLIEPVLRVLPELCAFIGRNLPFVKEVALMACEPTGFALANRDSCEVDLAEWQEQLEQGVRQLLRRRIPYLFMNAPICSLPSSLRSSARRSISDWKNVYAAECDGCAERESCCGLFTWHERGWKPTRIEAIREVCS